VGAEIRYAESDDVSLAYAVEGESGLPLISIPGIVSNLALDESIPMLARFYERLARFSRLVRWDRRGTGLSDQSAEPLALVDQARDLEAIRSAVGFERFVLIANSHGTTLAVRYAAANPERVSHLVLIAAVVCDARDPSDPASPPLAPWDRLIQATHDFPTYVDRFLGAAAPRAEPAVRARGANLIKASVSPRGMRQLLGQIRELDLRGLLSEIRVPTLVIHANRDGLFPVAHGRFLGAQIPGVRYVELDTDFHTFFMDAASTAVVLTAIEEFVTGGVQHTADRVMTTVLFTDIVESTAAQQRIGDEAWRTLRKSFEANSRRLVEQFGGRVVQFTGDGVMAAFPAASQALRAARALVEDARGLGVAIRAGVHSGEAYTVEDQLFGTCVTVAARVAAKAGAGELLTTETVQDLVAGSGFAFRDAGVAELKGLGSRRLLAVLGH
jgi:pimeloyl-ACP methyl ester carboxylesterase